MLSDSHMINNFADLSEMYSSFNEVGENLQAISVHIGPENDRNGIK